MLCLFGELRRYRCCIACYVCYVCCVCFVCFGWWQSVLSALSAGTGWPWGLSALAEVRRSVHLPDGWWVVVALSALAAVRLPVLLACLPAVVAAWPRVWPAVSVVCALSALYALSRTCTLSAPLFLLCLFCLRCVFLFCLP